MLTCLFCDGAGCLICGAAIAHRIHIREFSRDVERFFRSHVQDRMEETGQTWHPTVEELLILTAAAMQHGRQVALTTARESVSEPERRFEMLELDEVAHA